MKSRWTEEISDRAVALAKAGASATAIRRMMEMEFAVVFTRNAIIGRLHRLHQTFGNPNYSQKQVRPKPETRLTIATVRRATRTKSLAPAVIVELPRPRGFLGILFSDLQYGQCRYPRGDVPAISFCGQPVRNSGESWCVDCRKIVYAKAPVPDEEKQRRLAWGLRQSQANRSSQRERAA